MALIPVSQIAAIGLNKDLPTQKLPLHAWTDIRNAVLRDGYIDATIGAVATVSTQSGITWIEIFKAESGNVGLVANNTDVYAFDDTTIAEVTRVAGDYNGSEYDFWHGGMFQGFGIICNGVDVPQSWNPLNTSTKLINLPNWQTSTVLTKVIRGFKNFLVALDVTKSGVRDPRMVKWSHSADPNTLPSSWDETDAAKDAGEISLHSGYDGLVDCLPMGDNNIIYTEGQTWAMKYIGGESIFAFQNLFPSSGLLALDCGRQFASGHFVVSQDDIIVHNGSSINSVADASVRRWFFSELSSAYYKLTRVIRRLQEREMWICFSTSGAALDTALIWNWRYNTWTIRELPTVKSIASSSSVYAVSADSWGVGDYTWDGETTSAWGTTTTYKTAEVILMADGSQILSASAAIPETLTVKVERTGIAHVSAEEVDEYNYKELIAVRPFFSGGPTSYPVTVTVGYQNDLSSTVDWDASGSFYPFTDTEIALNVTGRYLAVKFEWAQVAAYKLHSYILDVVLLKEGL